jgi:hypothetical protein
MLGINRNVHFSVDGDKEAWHAVGDHLVHNEIWQGVLHLVGMRSVTYWSERTDEYAGRIHVQVEPSLVYPPGVFLAYNDHYDLTKRTKVPATRAELDVSQPDNSQPSLDKVGVAITVIEENWQESMQLFNQVFQRIADQMGTGNVS